MVKLTDIKKKADAVPVEVPAPVVEAPPNPQPVEPSAVRSFSLPPALPPEGLPSLAALLDRAATASLDLDPDSSDELPPMPPRTAARYAKAMGEELEINEGDDPLGLLISPLESGVVAEEESNEKPPVVLPNGASPFEAEETLEPIALKSAQEPEFAQEAEFMPPKLSECTANSFVRAARNNPYAKGSKNATRYDQELYLQFTQVFKTLPELLQTLCEDEKFASLWAEFERQFKVEPALNLVSTEPYNLDLSNVDIDISELADEAVPEARPARVDADDLDFIGGIVDPPSGPADENAKTLVRRNPMLEEPASIRESPFVFVEDDKAPDVRSTRVMHIIPEGAIDEIPSITVDLPSDEMADALVGLKPREPVTGLIPIPEVEELDLSPSGAINLGDDDKDIEEIRGPEGIEALFSRSLSLSTGGGNEALGPDVGYVPKSRGTFVDALNQLLVNGAGALGLTINHALDLHARLNLKDQLYYLRMCPDITVGEGQSSLGALKEQLPNSKDISVLHANAPSWETYFDLLWKLSVKYGFSTQERMDRAFDRASKAPPSQNVIALAFVELLTLGSGADQPTVEKALRTIEHMGASERRYYQEHAPYILGNNGMSHVEILKGQLLTARDVRVNEGLPVANWDIYINLFKKIAARYGFSVRESGELPTNHLKLVPNGAQKGRVLT